MHCINKFNLYEKCSKETLVDSVKVAKVAIDTYDGGECNIDECLANIPMGLEYIARLTTNYLQLKTIYAQRKNHRSEQWKDFCDWIQSLPLAKELIVNGRK